MIVTYTGKLYKPKIVMPCVLLKKMHCHQRRGWSADTCWRLAVSVH